MNFGSAFFKNGMEQNMCEVIFLHAKPWIPGGEISIFTAVIH